MSNRTHRLSVAEYAATVAKVAKLNDRARRRGWTGRVEVNGEQVTMINVPDSAGRLPFPDYAPHAEIVLVDTTITGEPPRYAGWEFLAALEALPVAAGEVNWLVRCAPGTDDSQVDRSQLIDGWCGHCRKIRRNRRRLCLVRNTETGELVQVGTTCIKDFLGWDTNPVFLWADDAEDELDRTRQISTIDQFTPRTVVAAALAATEAYGWAPRAAAYDGRQPTSSVVEEYLWGHGNPAQAARKALAPHITEATTQADIVIAALIEAYAQESHGYTANLHATLTAQSLSPRQLGIACSAGRAYHHLTAPPADPAPEPIKRAWLGALGDKVQISGTITTALTVDGYAYNTTQRLLIIDAGPTLAKIYTAAGWAYEVDRGDHITVTATVKKHDTYNDEPQTLLTRAKRLPDPTDNPN